MVLAPVDAAAVAAPALWAPGYLKALLVLAGLSLVLLLEPGQRPARLHLSLLDELPGLVGRLLVAVAAVALVHVLRHDGAAVVGFLASASASVALVVAGRAVTTAVLLSARRRGVVAHRTVVVGSGPLAGELITMLRRLPRYGLVVVGVVDDAPGPDGGAEGPVPHLGRIADLEPVVTAHAVEVLLVADGTFDEVDLQERVRSPACLPCELLVVPRLHAFRATGNDDHIGTVPVVRVRTPSLHGVAWTVKRAADLVLGAVAIVLAGPVLLGCAVAVYLEGGPGVIFRQARVSRDGRQFSCLKFRSMRPVDDAESATRWSVVDDARIGPVGRFLRRTSLDELPQLWNVLRGDMTLVGPRPERPHFVRQFSLEHPRYAHRHRVPAGMTGLAQVSGLRGVDGSIAERSRTDNYYIENWSLWLDVKVLLRTVLEVLGARGR